MRLLIKKCNPQIESNIQGLVDLYQADIKDITGLKNYFLTNGLSRKQSTEMMNIYNKKHPIIFSSQLKILSELMDMRDEKLSTNNQRIETYRIYKKDKAESLFLSLMIEGLVAAINNDKKMSKMVMLRLIKLDPDLIISELSSTSISNTQRIKLDIMIPFVFNYFQKVAKNKKYFSFMFLNLSKLLKSSKKLMTYYKNNGPILSINEIRKYSKNKFYSILFPELWFRELKKRASREEATRFLTGIFKKINLGKKENQELSIFKYLFPKNVKLRRSIARKILKLRQSPHVRDRFLFLKLLEIKVIKNEISLLNSFYLKPLFLIKRKLLKEDLEDSLFINYSLHRLFALGDYNEKLLLWVIL